ncbi:MAG: YraN family protein [Porticoccaceae bacterium]|nr:YraN family protein [Porticoccaceae bacterium]
MDFTGKLKIASTASAIGMETEQIAFEYLVSNGLTPLDRNFNTPRGEIDIIMRDNMQLIFVEVRFRQSDYFGGALASITRQKYLRMTAAAQAYMQLHKTTNSLSARFDVIGMRRSKNDPSGYQLDWIKNVAVN